MNSEPVLGDRFQRSARQLHLLFQRHVGIIHGSGANDSLLPLPRKLPLEKIDGVDLDQHIAIEILDTIALATRITVNTSVLTASLEIQIVVQAEDGVDLRDSRNECLGLDFLDHPIILLNLETPC